jgi:hypothetical protein
MFKGTNKNHDKPQLGKPVSGPSSYISSPKVGDTQASFRYDRLHISLNRQMHYFDK